MVEGEVKITPTIAKAQHEVETTTNVVAPVQRVTTQGAVSVNVAEDGDRHGMRIPAAAQVDQEPSLMGESSVREGICVYICIKIKGIRDR